MRLTASPESRSELNAIASRENTVLDLLKYISVLLIVASHCLPITENNTFNLYYGQWFFRFCVPLFFISSGYFYSTFSKQRKIKYIRRLFLFYLLATAAYAPLFIPGSTAGTLIRAVILGYFHLWYISALLIALCLLFLLDLLPCRTFVKKACPILAVVLLLIGAFFDEYQAFFYTPVVSKVSNFLQLLGGPRHALFFALPLLLLGKFLSEHHGILSIPRRTCVLLLIGSFALSFFECYGLVSARGGSITCDVTLFNFLPAVFLFILSFQCHGQWLTSRRAVSLRKQADVIYFLHIWVLKLIKTVTTTQFVPRLILVLLLSMLLSFLFIICVMKWRKSPSHV